MHYWLPAYGKEIPSQHVLGNIYENAYESSPDENQAIMFHGTNLDDLWRNGCNGKISRAMPEGHDKMMRRQNGAWVALGTLSLDYAPWTFLVKGWMVRVVMIVDRRATSPNMPVIAKET